MNIKKSTECIFQDLFSRVATVTFDQDLNSSDGGALLFKAADKNIGLIERLGDAFDDKRKQGKIKHDAIEILSQRIFAIACGYPDGNDAARLADDPIHKLLVGRDSKDAEALASQPTISRFENSADWRTLYRMGDTLAEAVVTHHAKRLCGKARVITIDLDPTDDPTHGNQQLTFFNGHYDTYCYLPMLGFVSFDREVEQYAFAALLRPGNAGAALGAVAIMRRILKKLKIAFPDATYLVRLDGGFATPEVFDFLDSESRVKYVVNMAKNAVLKRAAEKLMKKARRLSRKSGESERVFGECRYAAGTWDRKRRVIIKAEVLPHPDRETKDNPRFVVTNLMQTPEFIYSKKYCARGEVENRIKELCNGLMIDRTSCTSFKANQLRILLTLAAYILMQEIRRNAAGTAFARVQTTGIIENLIKLGAHVVVSVRRIMIHLPRSVPHRDAWIKISRSLSAAYS